MVRRVHERELPFTLRLAIERFAAEALAEEYHINGGGGMCLFAAEEFRCLCTKLGIQASLYEYDEPELERLWFVELPQPAAFHMVVRACGYVIDWTATQFDQSLPCPLIWLERDWPCEHVAASDARYNNPLEIIDYMTPMKELEDA